MNRHGRYEMVDGRPALVFERTYAHPVEAVWRAVTRPEELAHWFPARVEVGELRPGAPIRFVFDDEQIPPSAGQIVEVDPPRRLVLTWEDDELRFELSSLTEGCRFTFTNLLSGDYPAASVAAGWHVCLDELAKLLTGEPAQAPGTVPTPEHEQLREEYAGRGVPAGA